MSDAAADERRPAIFLDRDGTLNREVGYCGSPDRVELLPGVVEAIATLRSAGRHRLIVVTNQSGIARGLYGPQDLARVHDRMRELIGPGICLWLHCPHHPTEGADSPVSGGRYTQVCDCRKPESGMLRRAAELFDIDLDASWMVGDTARDLLAGARLGLRTCLVECGKDPAIARRDLAEAGVAPTLEVADLAAAVPTLLR